MNARPEAPVHEFKDLFERSLREAGLTPRTLRLGILADTKQDVPENSIDSWRRPHSATGQPSLPREETVGLLARWLAARDGVTVTEEELLGAWRADRAARAAGRNAAAAAGPGAPPARLGRGEFYEGIIDASIYLGMDDLLGRVDHRLRELLNTGQPIPTYFMYLTHRGYLNWVARTEDPQYAYHRAALELCEARAGDIAAAILAATGGGDVDFVSLGPGTGSKDRALLQSLAAALGPAGGTLYYYPYDINPAMIVHAIQTVLSGELAARVLVKGIIAPFDSLGLFSPVYRDRAAPNVLALLGNSLGNMGDDYGFLETILAGGMCPGDLLLLEVRCHVDEDAGQAPGMGEETKRRLNFGPLEILGASYDEHRHLVTVRREHSRSVIPGTVTTVTRCEQVRCGAITWRDVRLCYVHEYSEPELDDVLAEIGYHTVAKLHRGVRGADSERVVLLYLLQKP
ncbi:MAG TPA: L-histidine N(alpha)-methyltransferase [Acidimicrobiia bacterium]